jgi:hypothetical protein
MLPDLARVALSHSPCLVGGVVCMLNRKLYIGQSTLKTCQIYSRWLLWLVFCYGGYCMVE